MCSRCPGNPALWLVEAALLELNPSVSARKLMAKQPGYTIDDDPFIHLELMLATVLATSYGAKAAQAEQVLREALTPPIDRDTVKAAVKKVGQILGTPIDDSTQTKIGIYINDLMSKGAHDAKDMVEGSDNTDSTDSTDDGSDDGSDDENSDETDIADAIDEATANHADLGPILLAFLASGLLARGGSVEALPEIRKVFKVMADSIKYYSKKNIAAVVLPSIDDAVDSWLEDYFRAEGNGDELPDPTKLFESLGEDINLDAYWRTVANVSASRAYHYGLMKGADLFGASQFVVINPLDARTSEICQYLAGMVFDIDAAVKQMDETGDIPVSDLADVSPFLPPEDIIGKSPEELMQAGVLLPPYHFNCRSWAKIVE